MFLQTEDFFSGIFTPSIECLEINIAEASVAATRAVQGSDPVHFFFPGAVLCLLICSLFYAAFSVTKTKHRRMMG
jgi:predicted membrane channel-forming protein YqfA (hemolysin III family)